VNIRYNRDSHFILCHLCDSGLAEPNIILSTMTSLTSIQI
jgi:hypothetical protein